MTAGVLKQKEDRYTLRVLGSCGVFSAALLQSAAGLALRFGDGTVTATSRGTLEIGGIPAGRLEEALSAAAAAGLSLGGTGATVRSVSACKGTVCTKGLYDVHALASQLEEAFLGQPVPKKFKIGVYGCPNSLGKAMGQDVGIQPHLPFDGTFDLYLGGRMGRVPALGLPLGFPLRREQLIPALTFLLEEYRRLGRNGERLRTVMDREGPDLLEHWRSVLRALP